MGEMRDTWECEMTADKPVQKTTFCSQGQKGGSGAPVGSAAVAAAAVHAAVSAAVAVDAACCAAGVRKISSALN